MSTHTAPTGFVGVGNMGGAMAVRALSQGLAIIVYDPSPDARRRLVDAGAEVAPSAAEVARRCPTVSVVVNTDAQALAALLGADGILAGAADGTIVAIHSTIHIATLHELAHAAAAQGVTVLDAAVTGGQDAAARGQLAVMVGGDPAAIDKIRPALETYASLVLRAGDLGSGMSTKVALNAISYAKMAAAYDGMLLASRAGIDLAEFARVVIHSEANSGLHQFYIGQGPDLFGGASDSPFRTIGRHELPVSRKDLDAALALAASLGVTLPVIETTVAQMPAVWGLDDAGA